MVNDARALLEGLVGSDITTVTGRRNRVLAIEADRVRVATGRSPKGQLVDINDVQEALDQLVARRSVEISVKSVGYRSAFIGAVLGTLPGAVIDCSTSPPQIRLG